MLREGRIYKLITPTHIVSKGAKNYYYYGADDFERNKVNGVVTHLKGLGEFTTKQMEESIFGSNQHLAKYDWNAKSAKMLEDFMGKDVTPRKEYLFTKIDFREVME